MDELLGIPSEVIVAVGYHPKHASRSKAFENNSLIKMSRVLQNPKVKAVGEIGLDHSTHEDNWAYQMQLIRKIVPFITLKHVLVIHCRGMKGDHTGMEAHLLLLNLLKKLSKSQRVQVHSFMGNELIVGWWLKAFPEKFAT